MSSSKNKVSGYQLRKLEPCPGPVPRGGPPPLGFNYDSDGFLQVYLHGQLIDEPSSTGYGGAKEVVSFGIWFDEGNPM